MVNVMSDAVVNKDLNVFCEKFTKDYYKSLGWRKIRHTDLMSILETLAPLYNLGDYTTSDDLYMYYLKYKHNVEQEDGCNAYGKAVDNQIKSLNYYTHCDRVCDTLMLLNSTKKCNVSSYINKESAYLIVMDKNKIQSNVVKGIITILERLLNENMLYSKTVRDVSKL